jgi:leader peptidase (prepilin peptidase)/N-methyltransferase
MLEIVAMSIILFWFGLIGGSFVNALVWRLHVRKTILNDRSECVHCHHKLGVFDLIPLFSWLFLKGKCRYCHKKIDDNPLVELFTGLLFVGLYLLWPLPLETTPQVAHFIVWLIASILLVALFVYDLRWKLLPNVLVFSLIGLAVVDVLIQIFGLSDSALRMQTLINHILGLIPITGVYGLLYFVSKGRLVGFGDVKLGIFIGLILGWQSALLVLFIANVLGTLVVVPLMSARKLKKNSRIPFGPFLIAATFIALLWGQALIDWYLSLLFV